MLGGGVTLAGGMAETSAVADQPQCRQRDSHGGFSEKVGFHNWAFFNLDC
jgi:hypothetical protein